MRIDLRNLLSIGILAAAVPAQNLLVWNGWQPWNAQYVTQLQVTPTAIQFVPYDPGPKWLTTTCGIEQQVHIPADGWYQLRFTGVGGSTGTFTAHWEIQGQQTAPFQSDQQQTTWSFQLSAGTTTLRLVTTVSNLTVDRWYLQPPVLVSVLPPVVDVALIQRSMPDATFTTPGNMLALAPQSQLPIRFPGIGYGLELAPTSAIVVFAVNPTGSIRFNLGPLALLHQSWPSFYLQAFALSPAPAFGSVLPVAPFRF